MSAYYYKAHTIILYKKFTVTSDAVSVSRTYRISSYLPSPQQSQSYLRDIACEGFQF